MKHGIHKTAEKLRKEADLQAKHGEVQTAHRLLDIADDIDRIEEDLRKALEGFDEKLKLRGNDPRLDIYAQSEVSAIRREFKELLALLEDKKEVE